MHHRLLILCAFAAACGADDTCALTVSPAELTLDVGTSASVQIDGSHTVDEPASTHPFVGPIFPGATTDSWTTEITCNTPGAEMITLFATGADEATCEARVSVSCLAP